MLTKLVCTIVCPNMLLFSSSVFACSQVSHVHTSNAPDIYVGHWHGVQENIGQSETDVNLAIGSGQIVNRTSDVGIRSISQRDCSTSERGEGSVRSCVGVAIDQR